MIFKKALIIGISTIGTVGAVAGAGAGIAHAVQNQNDTNHKDEVFKNPNDNKEETKPSSSLENKPNINQPVSDQPDEDTSLGKKESVVSLTAAEVANSIMPKDIVVYAEKDGVLEVSKKEKLDIKTLFAFNIKKEQFGIDPDKKELENFDVTFELDSGKNTLKALNGGTLNIKVTVTEKTNKPGKQKETGSKDIELIGFNKPSDELKTLLKVNDDDKFSITLENKDKNVYSTIEDLNKTSMQKVPKKDTVSEEEKTEQVSGLTTLLWANNFEEGKYVGDIRVNGEVKLETLDLNTKQDGVVFSLNSAKTSSPLKIIQTKKDGKTDELLVGEIKTTNLLATDISIAAKGESAKENEELINAVKEAKDDNAKKGYEYQENDQGLYRKLSIKLTDNPANTVYLKAYTVQKTNTFEKDKNIPVDVTISFGKGTTAKRLTTSDHDQSELLKKVGINFNIYSKHLTGKNTVVLDGKDIKLEEHKLTSYLKDEHYKKFSKQVEVTEFNKEDTANNYGGFYLQTFDGEKPSELVVSGNDSRHASDLADIDTNLPANFLAFVGYSYKGIAKDNFAFTPTLTVIHLLK